MGGSPIDGKGGNCSVVAGNGVGSNGDGGDIYLAAGQGTGFGRGGNITVKPGVSPTGIAGETRITAPLTIESTSGVDQVLVPSGGPVEFFVPVKAPSPDAVDNSNRLATTDFVKAQSYLTIDSAAQTYASLSSPTFTGICTLEVIRAAAALGSAASVGFINGGGAGMLLASTTSKHVRVIGGTASDTSDGGNAELFGGSGGSTFGNGGSARVFGGGPSDEGNGGHVVITASSANSVSGSDRDGGVVFVTAGNAVYGGAGGDVKLTAGNSGTAGAAGNVVITAGKGGSAGGHAGSVSITGGIPNDGNGGAVFITASSGAGLNRQGGTVTIRSGDATGSSRAGDIHLIPGTTPGGARGHIMISDLPNDPLGLPAGALWSNNGVLQLA